MTCSESMIYCKRQPKAYCKLIEDKKMKQLLFENKTFYPTPEHLAIKLLNGINFNCITNILEPSAGKGDLVNSIINRIDKKHIPYVNIDCIEIDETLQVLLKNTEKKLIYNDFLSFNSMKKYDIIIANFPFDNGCKHLLKAIEIQERYGGLISCFINAETIRNPYSNNRKLLASKLDQYNASVEFISNGFTEAERKTNVDIAIIHITIKDINDFIDYDFYKKFNPNKVSFNIDGQSKTLQQEKLDQIASQSSFIDSLITDYETELNIGLELIKLYSKMKPFMYRTRDINKQSNYNSSYTLSLTINDGTGCDYRYRENILSANAYIKVIRNKYWSSLFLNNNFMRQMTSNLRERLLQSIDKMSEYDVNMFNIYTIMEDITAKLVKGIEDTIMKLFDELSCKHAYHEELKNNNIHLFNGWKTNKAWFINKKIILPNLVTNSNGISKLNDIHKTLSYLDGIVSDIDIFEEFKNLSDKSKKEYSCWSKYVEKASLPYFDIRFYLKGTAHITFTNQNLLDKFNLFACQNRNETPQFYGTKKYSAMNTKEKELVKDFSGSEENYNKLIDNQEYYLAPITCTNLQLDLLNE